MPVHDIPGREIAERLAFIQQHPGDPGLSPAEIAAAHHISLRLLHKLFQEQGETVAGWIRARRRWGPHRHARQPRAG